MQLCIKCWINIRAAPMASISQVWWGLDFCMIREFLVKQSWLPWTVVGSWKCFRGAGMAQWLEHSPPTNVARVQFLDPASYDCGLSLLLVLYSAPRGFSLGTPVSPPPSSKTNFPDSNSILECTGISNEFLWTPWCSAGKQITIKLFCVAYTWK